MARTTPPTKKTISASLTLFVLGLLAIILRSFWSWKYLYAISWFLLFVAYVMLYGGNKYEKI